MHGIHEGGPDHLHITQCIASSQLFARHSHSVVSLLQSKLLPNDLLESLRSYNLKQFGESFI